MKKQEAIAWSVYAVAVITAAIMLSSCGSTRHNNYQDHLRSTPTENWVRHDNGGCGWNR